MMVVLYEVDGFIMVQYNATLNQIRAMLKKGRHGCSIIITIKPIQHGHCVLMYYDDVPEHKQHEKERYINFILRGKEKRLYMLSLIYLVFLLF